MSATTSWGNQLTFHVSLLLSREQINDTIWFLHESGWSKYNKDCESTARDLIKLFYRIMMTDAFRQYSKINPLQSCHIRGGGLAGVGSDTWGISERQTWRLETSEVRCPPVTWSAFPLLSPLITVSDGKWWKGGGGVLVGWRDLGRKDGRRSVMRLRVKCNEPGNEPQGVSPFSNYFTANPVDALHLGKVHKHTEHVCVHVCLPHQHKVWQHQLQHNYCGCAEYCVFSPISQWTDVYIYLYVISIYLYSQLVGTSTGFFIELRNDLISLMLPEMISPH